MKNRTRRFLVLPALLVLALTLGSALTATAGFLGEIPFNSADGAYIIDGTLNEPAWAPVKKYSFTSPEYQMDFIAGPSSANLPVQFVKTGPGLVCGLTVENSASDGKVLIGVSPDGKNGGEAREKVYVIQPGMALKWFTPSDAAIPVLHDSIGQLAISGSGATWSAELLIPYQESAIPLQDTIFGLAIAYQDSGDGSGGLNLVGSNSDVYYLDRFASALDDVHIQAASEKPLSTAYSDLKLLKQAPTGTTSTLCGSFTVTESGSDHFYLESSDRLTGLKVMWPSSSILSVGQLIPQVTGTMSPSGAEPTFTANSVTIFPATFDPPGAFGITPSSLNVGTGLSNLSIRVRIFGNVTTTDVGSFTVTDGKKSVRVLATPTGLSVGQVVGVTGVCSIENGQPLLLATEVDKY